MNEWINQSINQSTNQSNNQPSNDWLTKWLSDWPTNWVSYTHWLIKRLLRRLFGTIPILVIIRARFLWVEDKQALFWPGRFGRLPPMLLNSYDQLSITPSHTVTFTCIYNNKGSMHMQMCIYIYTNIHLNVHIFMYIQYWTILCI